MPGDALELALVQDELDALVILGSLIGLTSQERVRYEELGDREVELLQARGRDSLVGAAIWWRPSVRRPRGEDRLTAIPDRGLTERWQW
jgi:hypothetical protein